VILIVLDGFGCRRESEWNAIASAKTPSFDRLFRDHPWTEVEASGLAVGLPAGQMGNSEVGHLNIGAGRIVDQDVVRISKRVEEYSLGSIPALSEAFAKVRSGSARMHFVGLLSDGGVHSLQEHLHGLIDAGIASGIAPREGEPSLFVHAILDGRDTPPKSAVEYVRNLEAFLESRPAAVLSTVVGRYYTMDRDKRWERTRRGWDLMTRGEGRESRDAVEAIESFYRDGKTDEFMEPIAVVDDEGTHHGAIRDGDIVLFFNFRADRMRQIVTAFRDDDFDGFERTVRPSVDLLSMTRYHQDFDIPVIFPPLEVRDHLGEVFAHASLRQLRIAETEKYAHVTFFFNGGSDDVSEGEERLLVPSPKVATYDLQPAMSVVELTDRVVEKIDSGGFDVVVMNIANPDMVGHTGVMDAAVTAVEETDRAIGRILEAVDRRDGVAIITADHGNCELMYDESTGQPHTAHTTSPVPVILYDSKRRFDGLRSGGALSNVAPTILEILGIDQPVEMTARSLLGGEEPGSDR